jgi:hypothetical protein
MALQTAEFGVIVVKRHLLYLEGKGCCHDLIGISHVIMDTAMEPEDIREYDTLKA